VTATSLLIAFAEARNRFVMFGDDISLNILEAIIEEIEQFAHDHAAVSSS
jgi:hypothetical protein